MEIIQIINDGHLSHNQWGGVLSLDGGLNQGHFVQDVLLAPFESNPVAPQYFIIDADGSIVPIMEGNNLTFLAPEPDDEVPSYKLDHMYAKKPREPGSEVVKPARRRSKKKEMLKSHYYAQEMMQETAPKINIIRGRHAMTLPGQNRPKILTSPQKVLSTFPSTNMFSTPTYSPGVSSSSSPGRRGRRNSKHHQEEIISQAVVFEDYEDFNAPSPGAVVTVCDGVEMDPAILSSRSSKSKQLLNFNISGQSPSSIENRNSSLDSIGEPEDDAELFLDFPMEGEEEVDTSIDVDFNEISMNSSSGIDILRSTPLAYFQSNSEPYDTEFSAGSPLDDSSPRMSDLESKSRRSPPHHRSQIIVSSDDVCFQSAKKIVRKRGRPSKQSDALYSGVSDFMDCVESGGSSAMIKIDGLHDDESDSQPSIELVSITPPTRRSTRPVKAPSRLDDVEDTGSSKRKRR